MEEIMTRFTAAVIQAGSVPFDSKSSTGKACKLIAEAAQRGAQLLVFPEAFISAYPKGLDFGAGWACAFRKGGPISCVTGKAPSKCRVPKQK